VTPGALAVDAGQTSTRAALGERVAGAGGVRRLDEAADAPAGVAATVLEAIAALGDLPPALAVGVGLSGFEAARPGDVERIGDAVRSRLGAEEVAIASDAVTSLLGALAGEPGVVVAAGTGAVTLGRNHAGEWAKVDGWGALLGDAGSGFAVGRAGIESALRAADGRGGSEPLRRAAEAEHGSLEALVAAVYRAPSSSRAVAAFAPRVAEAARAGDPCAAAIWRRAGEELAASTAAAARRLFVAGEAVEVSWAGGLFDTGALLLEPFSAALAERFPSASVVPPRGTSLDGARVLAADGAGLGTEPGLLWRSP
jgi:N-acetylglucosamine kinase-like BadF-type ATPase